jgi:hypothetical protein
VALRKGFRLRVFGNRVLGKIFEPIREGGMWFYEILK